eukprot:2452478-Amphidinium_carterae.1
MSQLNPYARVFKHQSESMFILSCVDDLLIIGEESEQGSQKVGVSDKDLNDGGFHESGASHPIAHHVTDIGSGVVNRNAALIALGAIGVSQKKHHYEESEKESQESKDSN